MQEKPINFSSIFKFMSSWRDFCKKHCMITPIKKIYITLFIITLAIEVPLVYFLKNSWFPFKITAKPGTYVKSKNYDFLFKDVNHDGQSEFLEIENDTQNKNFNIKIYRFVKQKLRIIDQFNFLNKMHPSELAFYDLNRDGWDELFVLTNDEDGLYLTVIDLYATNKYLLAGQKLIAAPKPNPFTYWDVERFNPTLLDVNNDGYPEFIFTVHSGLSLRPRGIYAFDLKKKRIVQRFDYHAGPAKLYLNDVNGDGRKEIILTTTATANWPDSVPYSDYRSWIFFLDKQFKPLVPPKSFALPFSSVNLISSGRKKKNRQIFYLNSRKKTQLFEYEHFRLKTSVNLPHAVEFFFTDQPLIYLFYRNLNRVEVFNTNLQLFKSYSFPQETMLTYVRLFKSTKHNRLFFVATLNALQIFDHNLKLLAHLPLNNQIVKRLSFYKENNLALPWFGLLTDTFYQQYKLVANRYYMGLPWIAILGFVLLFMLLFSLHLGVNRFLIYITYLMFSLRRSDNAIVLLNRQGKIISYNKKIKEWMNLNFRSLHDYRQALGNRRQILEVIEESMMTHKAVKRELRFEGDKVRFYGEVSVTPFFGYFKYVNAYLVELRDSTERILMERQKNWQQSVRSLVHDLKNPLAGLQLKVQTLYLKLQRKYPQAARELAHELETAYSEIKRIRRISQDFLKFTQLEQVNFQKIKLEPFLKRVMAQFDAFRSEKLHLKLHIDQNIPSEVNWDARQIESLLNIFVRNAIDALRGRGEIRLTVGKTTMDATIDAVSLLFRDNGPGIAADIKDKIFDPFFTTKKEGSGLGLAFANQIVLQHKGKIILPECSDGASFLIMLPVNPEILKFGAENA